jgi:phosphatidylglycerol:prolipoprotein diacylglycerol transferase
MPVYFYGIIMAVAVFVGFLTSDYLYKKLIQISVVSPSGERAGERGYVCNKKNNLILDISPYLIISGIIGARLYYCLVNYSYYIQNPLEIFFIRQGGLSIHGAIIAGALALFYFSKKHKIPFLCLTDIFLCGTILAQSIGRWGNFFNSEAFGLPCDLPWKLYIPISHRPLEYINFEYFHPAFLYESLLDLGIFVVLFIVIRELEEGRKIGRLEGRLVNKISLSEYTQEHNSDNSLPSYSPTFQPSGLITSLYLILYAIARIFVEHFRIDSALNISGIPIAQIISFVMVMTGAFLLYRISVKKRPN